MKLKGCDLVGGIKKSRGVVEDSLVIEYLRGFRFNPRVEEGLVDIAGSDGRMTLLATIPFVESEDSDNSVFSVSSNKVQELVKYIKDKDDVEFKYTEDSNSVEIMVGAYSLKVHKKEFENELIDFDMVKENDFDDTLELESFVFVLDSLINVLIQDDPDLVYQTIYFDGDYAYAFTGDTYVKVEFKTNKQYLIDYRIAKQLLVLLKNTTGESVNLKIYEDMGQIMVKTDSDLLVYRLMDDEIYNVDGMQDFKDIFSFKVDLSGLVRSINMTSLGSDDGDINLKIEDGVLKLSSINDLGELAYDEIQIKDLKGNAFKDDIQVLCSTLVKLSKAIREKEVEISIDTDNNILRIKDDNGIAVGYMTFEN